MRSLLALTFVGAVLFACGHDDDDDHSHDGPSGGHTSKFASCQAIIDACHPKDTGEGAAHDCHDQAHAPAATEASCAAKKDACLTTCTAPAGPADAGATDGGAS